jgi:uncharacterized protein (UPF0548 family)
VGFLHLTPACRAVNIVGAEDASGFSCGTPLHHVEFDEERFMVERDAERVRFVITSCSRPGHPLVGPPGATWRPCGPSWTRVPDSAPGAAEPL